MLESSIESVVYVCREEAARLRQLVSDLNTAEPRRLESILRNLSATGETLSGALARASSYVDHLEGEHDAETQHAAPPDDSGLLEVVRRLQIATAQPPCPVCGGVKQGGARELECAAANEGSIMRAHSHAQEVYDDAT